MRFFHASASTKKKRNSFNKLVDDSGVVRSWGHGLEELIVDYSDNMFTKAGNDDGPILDLIQHNVNYYHNTLLCEPYTEEEVRTAAFSMHLDKSSGPDGMNPAFYQHFWHIVKGDVVAASL